MNVVQVRLDLIDQNENSRVVYKENDLSELMASMRKDGLLQPVGVIDLKNGRYEAMFGNRRIVAAKKLGWDSISAQIFDSKTDTERDILNMVENFKRTNTTVAEDGRMFDILRTRGLSVGEIAARLGVTKLRIQNALDVISMVPKSHRKDVVNKATQRSKDKISASSAHRVLHLRSRYELTQDQTGQLLDYSKRDGITAAHINSIAPLLKSGMTLDKAMMKAETMRVVQLKFFMSAKDIARIKKTTGQHVSQVIMDFLKSEWNFTIQKIKAPGVASDFRVRRSNRVDGAA